jgi:hypothetical protein
VQQSQQAGAAPAQAAHPSGQLDFSDLGGKIVSRPVKMVGPKGEVISVQPQGLSEARANGYAVHPDNPGVTRFVNPDGKVAYALPTEVDAFKKGGSTQINPDGSFDLQAIFGEDPLEEQKRYQRVREALTPQEKTNANNAELKQAAKAGAGAALATAGGVVGAQALSAGMEAGGTALANSEAGQLFASSPKLYAEYLLKQGIKGVGKYALEHKLGTAIVIDQLAKVLGIQKSTVMHKLLTAGGSAIAE